MKQAVDTINQSDDRKSNLVVTGEDSANDARKEMDIDLKNLPDRELISLYYQLCAEYKETPSGMFYPNIKELYATPFEREKDRREQPVWQPVAGRCFTGAKQIYPACPMKCEV